MNGDSVNIGIIHKPDSLVHEQISVVLCVQVWLSWFRGVELQTFSDSFSQDIDGRISFHDFINGLKHKCPDSREVIPKSRMHIIGQINSNETPGWRRVYRDTIGSIIQKLGTCISLNIM